MSHVILVSDMWLFYIWGHAFAACCLLDASCVDVQLLSGLVGWFKSDIATKR